MVLLAAALLSASLYASTWEYIGPDTVSFTAMHNFGNGHLIAATMIDGVGTRQPLYVSSNYGKTWDTLCRGFSYYKVEQFAFLGNKLYACLSDVYRTGLKSRGYEKLFFSLDSGKTWNLVNDFTGDDAFWAVGKDSIIVTGNSYYVSRSVDYGKTWTTHNVGNGVCYSVETYGDTIYAGCYKGLWVSKDWGKTWALRSIPTATILTLNFVGKTLIEGETVGIQYHRNFGIGENDWKIGLCVGQSNRAEAFPIKDSMIYAYLQYNSACHLYYSIDTAKTFTRFWLENDTSKNIVVNSFFSDGVYAFALTKKGIYRRLIYENTSKIPFNNKPSTAKYTPVSINNNQIVLDMPANSTLELTVFSLNGKALKKSMVHQTGSGKIYLPVSDFCVSDGLYVIQAKAHNRIYIQKIVVKN